MYGVSQAIPVVSAFSALFINMDVGDYDIIGKCKAY